MEEKEITLKEAGKITRLTNKTFKFDSRIEEGFFSANYFLKTRKVVMENEPNHIVTAQFFQRKDNVTVCGVDESIALIHTFAKNPEKLEIYALNDGDVVQSGEPVLKITGKYEDFGYLESLIDGLLARRSSVATNVAEVVKALRGANTFSMADRQDDYLTQTGDGYATYVGGIKAFSTNAQGLWVNKKGLGTMPHALIEVCGGDTVKACKIYHKTFPDEQVCALVDYHNNVIPTALACAEALGQDLGAVRVDTSKSLIDHYFDKQDTSGFDPHGVCKELIYALREALDSHGYTWVKITVSSGFTAKKIDEWTKLGVPVDTYGVGSSLVKNTTVGFTGDLVSNNGKSEAKEGRHEIASSRLVKVPYPIY